MTHPLPLHSDIPLIAPPDVLIAILISKGGSEHEYRLDCNFRQACEEGSRRKQHMRERDRQKYDMCDMSLSVLTAYHAGCWACVN